MSCFEALLRWRPPGEAAIPPGEFVPLAEETGLIVPIGEWALRQALSEAAKWPRHIRVAVNLSPVQFNSRNLSQMSALAASGVEPRRLSRRCISCATSACASRSTTSAPGSPR